MTKKKMLAVVIATMVLLMMVVVVKWIDWMWMNLSFDTDRRETTNQ